MRELLVICLMATAPLFATAADLTIAQKTQVQAVARLLRQAGENYQAAAFDAAGKNLADAMDKIDEALLDAGPDVYDAISPAFSKLVRAQAMLELEGVMVRPFAPPDRPESVAKDDAQSKAMVDSKPVRPARRKPAPPINPLAASIPPISFTQTVAPILVQHCGRCHVEGSRGDFSMATFARLAQGPPEGVVIFAGDVAGSRLIETIETGSMPKGGGSVPPEHLKILKDWIAGGAKYDGASPELPLASMGEASSVPVAPPTVPAAQEVQRPTGEETVSFARDIAPILLKNCNGCHVDAMQVRGGLRMDTFALLLAGGDSGTVIESRKAAASLLVRKIKGEEGQRMPAGGRPALSDESITLISRWIDEGASLDGDSADQPLAVMSSLAWAKSASDEELNDRRKALATENLKLVSGQTPRTEGVASEHFFVTGDASGATLEMVSGVAHSVWKDLDPFVLRDGIRGRITIFVMPRRYEYSEFAKMAEQRSVPADWQSHWRYDGIDAYIVMVAGSNEKDAAVKAKLVSPLASLAVVMRARQTPRWFAEGVGRVAASRLVARDLPVVETWKRDLPAAVSNMKDGSQFIKNDLPPEQSDLVAYGVVGAMVSKSQRRQYDALLKAMPTANSFDDAFQKSFGVTPTDYVTRLRQSVSPAVRGR